MVDGWIKWVALCAGAWVASSGHPACAIPSPAHDEDASPGEPSYTAAQAHQGGEVYASKCAVCHGDRLQGAAGPALVGRGFIAKWTGANKTLQDFRTYLQANMPKTAPDSLAEADSYALVAYILSINGYRGGTDPLNVVNAWDPFTPPGGATVVRPRITRPLPAAPDTVAAATTASPDDAKLSHPGSSDWLVYNGDLSGQRYSRLAQINHENAHRLTATCLFQLGEIGSFQASPVVFDGMMYVTSPYKTYAINPTTCASIWTSSYPVDEMTLPVTLNRGVAIYRGKLFRVTPNGHLIALDAKTGKLLWDSLLDDEGRGYWLSVAPVAYDGRVFVGLAGADWGVDGHIYALATETGRLDWTFDAIPTGDEVGADSWKAGAAHGGGSSWSTYTLDPKEGLLLASIGNPAPDYDGDARPGDNLFTDSVVALDYRTGKPVWWVQQVPHDIHDWDTGAAPTLYEQGGLRYLTVANKGGWLYLYDRDTRQLLAQPEVSPHLNADKPLEDTAVRHCPGILGGVAWNGVAYSPRDQLIYVNSVHWCGVTKRTPTRFIEGRGYFGGVHTFDPPELAKGWTRAFNAATGAPVWSRESKTPMLAALTPSAGGVLFTGDLDGNFLVLDSRTGERLYRFNTGGAVAGAPSTYVIGGRQYVAITSGNLSRTVWKTNGAMTVVVFSLPDEPHAGRSKN